MTPTWLERVAALEGHPATVGILRYFAFVPPAPAYPLVGKG